MTIETLFPNGDDAGWPSGGFADIDESIAAADGLIYTTTIKNASEPAKPARDPARPDAAGPWRPDSGGNKAGTSA